ncbi:MAG: nucleoside triphosphate pyrophosphohydrolase [Deltaproteobacteria bacterium]|nr:nucleoside triphosphate pyrophosphohydrolase [Deltaproteobacteria bacterium]
MERSVDSLPAGFEGLVALVEILRSDRGCPWDREQTAEQIKTYLLEEAYELLEALDSDDPKNVSAELGDLLFHIVFLARIFEEAGVFDMGHVIQLIMEKMIRRHPHVFGEIQLSNSDEVRRQWHEIKQGEAKLKDAAQSSSLSSVPRNLPALMRAYRICERASRLSSDASNLDSTIEGLDKTLATFKASLAAGDSAKLTEGLGDLLFAIVNLGRIVRVHPEAALTKTTEKFVAELEPTGDTPEE